MPDASETYLTGDEEQLLLRIARDALESWVRQGERIDLGRYAVTPTLREKHGAFVTLRENGELRGCIGYTQNREPLAVAVRDNAINAASNDPRFEPVRADELQAIKIEISALTPGETPDSPFKRVRSLRDIVIGRDGLYIERPPYRGGLLLPQVAVEQKWDVGQFLAAVCRKAGYPEWAWEDPETQLYRFSAQVFSE
jgi:AmmeMemoRadiSam system protein A